MFIYFEGKYVNFDLVRHIQEIMVYKNADRHECSLVLKTSHEDYVEHFDCESTRKERLEGILKQLGTEISRYPRD